MNRIFVYGTLKTGFHNNRLLQGQTLVCKAETANPQVMECTGIPFLYDSIRYLREEPKSYKAYTAPHVTGEVWDVDDEALQLIDGLEGHPRWYRRRKIALRQPIGGFKDAKRPYWNHFNAEAYYMTPTHVKDGLPIVTGEVRRTF